MRKGQAAMEFLMTYGWAILVVLAAIGALAYFGVLSPDRFLPDKCVAAPPFTCAEYKASSISNNLSLRIQNNAGYDVSILSVTLNGTQCTGTNGTIRYSGATTGILANGEDMTVQITLANVSSQDCPSNKGQKVKGDFFISYQQTDGTITKTATGNVQVRTE